MATVGCPVLRIMVGFGDAHRDDGIEEATDLSDDPFQLSDVRVG
ncbi:MAG: hypothetical protein ACXW38_01925 [Nitrospira sp.]